jgi:hypothetical protein
LFDFMPSPIVFCFIPCAHSPMALIFIQHLLLQCIFSLRAFSYYAPFQTVLIFITRIKE